MSNPKGEGAGMSEQEQSVQVRASAWISAFSEALASRSRDALGALFLTDAGWRDLLAFTWNVRQAHDREAIMDLMLGTAEVTQPADFVVSPTRPAPSEKDPGNGSTPVIEVFFSFRVAAGQADGVAYLVPDPSDGGLQAKTLFTRLTGLDEAPVQWPPAGRWDVTHPGVRWRDEVKRRNDFEDREPEVLVVGGGHQGVMTAAHLSRLGIDALIIDKHARVGDCWRERYDALQLHQPHNLQHFPYMRFPESFEEYLSKDQFADWFEIYVKSLELNFWTSAEFVSGSYDEVDGSWSAEVRRGDGSARTLRPKYLILAIGEGGIPKVPDVPGLKEFTGEIIHSAQFRDGADYAGKKVFIVGAGTSAHDFAHDIVNHGGTATIMQRGPLMVVDLKTANNLYGDYLDRDVPTEVADVRAAAATVFHQQRRDLQEFQQFVNVQDKELHEGLANAGMDLWTGEDATGHYYSYLSGTQNKGGFYLNVGASAAIINGSIALMNMRGFASFDAEGIVRADGTREKFDVVILATGYYGTNVAIEKYFGAEFNRKIGPVWGFDTDGEMRNAMKPTAQEGFLILEGSIPIARQHALSVALLVKAELLGIVPDSFKQADHISRTPTEPVPALAPYWAGRK